MIRASVVEMWAWLSNMYANEYELNGRGLQALNDWRRSSYDTKVRTF